MDPSGVLLGGQLLHLGGGGVTMFFTEIAMVQRESFKAKQNWAERCG